MKEQKNFHTKLFDIWRKKTGHVTFLHAIQRWSLVEVAMGWFLSTQPNSTRSNSYPILPNPLRSLVISALSPWIPIMIHSIARKGSDNNMHAFIRNIRAKKLSYKAINEVKKKAWKFCRHLKSKRWVTWPFLHVGIYACVQISPPFFTADPLWLLFCYRLNFQNFVFQFANFFRFSKVLFWNLERFH